MTSFYNRLIIGFIIFYPWLFIWQGIDLADMGIFARDYMTIEQAPAHTYLYCCYLTLIIGHLWESIVGFLGYINFKIAYIAIIYLTIYIAYKILSYYFSRQEVLVGVFVTLIYATTAFTKWIDYDNLTNLFYLIAIFFAVKGLHENKKFYFILFGFFIGLNIFIRVSNVAFFILFIPLILNFTLKKRIIDLLQAFLNAVLGIVLGCLVVFFLLITLNHEKLFFDSVFHMFSASINGGGYHHNVFSLLKKYLSDILRFFILAFYYILPFIVLKNLYKHKTLSVIQIVLWIILLSVFFILGHLMISNMLNGTKIVIENMQPIRIDGLLYSFSILMMVKKDIDLKYKVLILWGLLLMFLLAFGSAAGLYKQIYGVWLITPLFFIYIYRYISANQGVIGNIMKIGVFVFVLVSVFYSLTLRMEHTPKNAFQMFTSVENERMNLLFTEKKKAKNLSELLFAMKKYVPENSFLLMDGYAADNGIYYVTKTIPFAKPYTHHIEPYNKEIKSPYVIIHHNVINSELKNFVRINDYLKVFDNANYQLWVPIKEKS